MGFTKKTPMWYDLSIRTSNDPRTFSADVHVPSDSPWFKGHFPGNPVLPGIAQIAMVFDLLSHALSGPLRVTQVQRVRFKQMIVPGDSLYVSAEARPAGDGSYAFRISKGQELVCSGVMTVKTTEQDIEQAKGEPTDAGGY